jgi:protein TonB
MEYPLPLPHQAGPRRVPSRHAVIAGGVVLLHLAALWAMQTGLIRRVVEAVVPVQVLSEFIEPPRPRVEPPPPVPRPMAPAAPRKMESPPPMPLAVADPTPAPNAPTGVLAPPPALPPMAAPTAPPRVELPSSDADYLQNPKPVYPAMSKRFGEQGQVVLRVLIGADGVAQKAEIRRSSGYDRLDHAALATVQRWRYVPGRRGGVPEAMWFNVPIHFVLE